MNEVVGIVETPNKLAVEISVIKSDKSITEKNLKKGFIAVNVLPYFF